MFQQWSKVAGQPSRQPPIQSINRSKNQYSQGLGTFRLTGNSTRNGKDLEISTGYCVTILTANVGMWYASGKLIPVLLMDELRTD
jgi:hypothetical protein